MLFPLNSVSQSFDAEIYDDAGLPVLGLLAATFPPLFYSLAGANADVAFPALSDLATIGTAWTAGGVKERGNGVYRVDGPNGLFTTLGKVTVRGDAVGKHMIAKVFEVGVKLPATIAAGDIAANAIDANSVKADAVTKIQVGLMTSAAYVVPPTAAQNATAVELQIMDDADTRAVMQALVDKIALANPDLGGLTLSAIAQAVATLITADHGAGLYTRNTEPPTAAAIAAAWQALTLSNEKTYEEAMEFITAMVGGAKASGALASGAQIYVVRNTADTADLANITNDGVGNRTLVNWP